MTKFKSECQSVPVVSQSQKALEEALLANEAPMLSVSRYKAILGVGHTTAAKHIRDGVIASCLIGKRRLIFRDSVKHLLLTQSTLRSASNDNLSEGGA